jgi:rod shape-determining protein MreD
VVTLLAIPIFILLGIFQSAVVSRLPLLQGTADLVLLVVAAWALQERVRNAWQWALIAGFVIGYISALNMLIPLLGYLLVTGIALLLRQRVWQVPILAMLSVTFVGTLLLNILTAIYLTIFGATLPILETMNLIILPSIILNLLLSIPVYALVRDFSEWLYPEEIDL